MSGDAGNLGAASLPKNQVNHAHTVQHAPIVVDSSPAMGDAVFDWSIGLGIVIVLMFYATSFLFFKERDEE